MHAQQQTLEQPTVERRRECYAILKQGLPGAYGLKATILCMAISHLRRHLHCQSYKLGHGGWRGGTDSRTKQQDLRTRNGFDTEHAQRYLTRVGYTYAEAEYAAAVIENLDDQATFLRKQIEVDNQKTVKAKEAEDAGRKIYSWMRPTLTPRLRRVITDVLDLQD